MSRCIDAEWLKELYKPYESFNGKMYSVPIGAILANIDDAPSIDIVLCGECEHCIYGNCSKLHLSGVNSTDGCTWGERRE